MRLSAFWLLALLATVVVLEGNWVRAAPSRRTDDLLKALQNLDEIYSSMARPSVRSGPATQPDMGPKVQRAINMLRIQHLERLYADRARPRFGKRTESAGNNFPVADYENQRYIISPILRKVFQQNLQNWNPVSKWGIERLAAEPEMRTNRRIDLQNYSPVDNHTDFV